MGRLRTSINAYGTMSAVITRADGTVEDLGIIAQTSKWEMFKYKLAKRFRR